ncbi:MAG: exodeoxyribonuclease VII small subunit [Bifidobacteriaceae bacterium]|jgi:exodeoxyribonuclease VII small subunit|nr:exodeoxyribonuclease VII small subunit [Bifidobacteriaceae bacterium]
MANQATPPTPVEELTYEQARAELVSVVQSLEAGSQTLEEALNLWERGEALAARCQAWLDQAKARIEAPAETD